jgi:glycine cleavage system H lipoate-binding protein
MTVILVLSTFVVFILIDFVLSRNKVVQTEEEYAGASIAVLDPSYVEGFLVPEKLQYHPGHSWVMRERKRLARVGVDEFAAALMGRIERIELPKPGTWLRQGQKAFSFYRDGEKTEVLSPTEGEVVEVNREIAADASLLRKDPYGSGWLLMVNVPDEETVSRNMVPTGMVRSWMRDAVERLYSLQPQLAGAVAADGGRPAEDLFAALPGTSWRDLTAEFFLTN